MRIRLTFDIPENTEGQQAQPEAPETSATVVQTETGYAVWLRPADNYVTGAGPMRQAHCKSTLPEALIDIAEHFGATYDPDFDVQFGDDATPDPFDGPAQRGTCRPAHPGRRGKPDVASQSEDDRPDAQ